MKKIRLISTLIVLVFLVAAFVSLESGVAFADSGITVTSSAEGEVTYGASVVLTAVFPTENEYESVTYTWLKNDTAGGWDVVGSGLVLELTHVADSGDYKCKAECFSGGKLAETITSSGRNVKIIPKEISVTIDDRRATYGSEELPLSYSLRSDKLVGSDDLQITLEREPGVAVGVYEIYGSSANFDYQVSFVRGEYIIEKKPLEISYRLIGMGIEDGSETKVKVTINGIIGDDIINYSLSNDLQTSAGRYTANLQIEADDNYSVADEELEFSYVIYKKHYENEGIICDFPKGVLPEASLVINDGKYDVIPSGEELVTAKDICFSYLGVSLDGGNGSYTFTFIKPDGRNRKYHAYLIDSDGYMNEVKAIVQEDGLHLETEKCGVVLITIEKLSLAEKICIGVGCFVVALGIAIGIAIPLSKKKKIK